MKLNIVCSVFILSITVLPGSLLAQEWFTGPLAGPPTGTANPTSSNAATANNPSNMSVDANQLDTSSVHTTGDWVTRLGLDFTAFAGLQNGEMNFSDDVVLGVNAGAGYFPTDMLSADIDLSGNLRFTTENMALERLAVTPGTRFYPIDQLFLRLGMPVVVTDPLSINGLAGVGYEIPVGDGTSLVGEASVTYPLSEDGEGTVVLGGGTTLSF